MMKTDTQITIQEVLFMNMSSVHIQDEIDSALEVIMREYDIWITYKWDYNNPE